jgi:putative SOS response-associated peptidase YedK
MCGRFVSATPPDQVAAYFGAELAADPLPANFNVAPTNEIYGVVATPTGPQLQVFHWGLVPHWAKDRKISQKMINARAETVAEKPAFKSILRKYRCIIPADGFYEWQVQTSAGSLPGTTSGKPAKQPMYIHRLDGEPLAFAGLWSVWTDKSAAPGAGGEALALHSATIITTTANGTMTPVHDRMPVILPASRWHEWLDPSNNDLDALTGLLVPAPDDLLTMHPVSTEVNNVRNKGEQLITPFDPAAPKPEPPAPDSLFG